MVRRKFTRAASQNPTPRRAAHLPHVGMGTPNASKLNGGPREYKRVARSSGKRKDHPYRFFAPVRGVRPNVDASHHMAMGQ
jgi:hypothetical protein